MAEEKPQRRLHIRGKDIQLQWSQLRGTRRQDLVDHRFGFPAKTLRNFMAEIPANSHTGKHRHLNEAIIYIISGKGYSIIDGDRYDWEAGDFLSVPVYTWHQHFNTDPEKPALYLGTVNQPLMEYMEVRRADELGDGGPNT